MPAALKSLTSQQKQTLAYIIGCVLILGAAGFMFYDGRGRQAQAAALLNDVKQKELQAQSIQLPSDEELQQWTQHEEELQKLLISDQNVPQFYQEVSRLVSDNRLERYVVNTEEHTIDPNKSPTPDELKLLNVGVKRYLIMTLTFKAQYADMARFLSQVKALPHPVAYTKIALRRNPPYIDATLVMHVYKKEGS